MYLSDSTWQNLSHHNKSFKALKTFFFFTHSSADNLITVHLFRCHHIVGQTPVSLLYQILTKFFFFTNIYQVIKYVKYWILFKCHTSDQYGSLFITIFLLLFLELRSRTGVLLSVSYFELLPSTPSLPD